MAPTIQAIHPTFALDFTGTSPAYCQSTPSHSCHRRIIRPGKEAANLLLRHGHVVDTEARRIELMQDLQALGAHPLCKPRKWSVLSTMRPCSCTAETATRASCAFTKGLRRSSARSLRAPCWPESGARMRPARSASIAFVSNVVIALVEHGYVATNLVAYAASTAAPTVNHQPF